MTGEPQMTDSALDSALAKSRDPMVPAGLAQRVAAQAMTQPQRRMGASFQARRTRRSARKNRARRPVLFGAIGGALMAASAVAASLVGDGSFELARITKPVVEFFVPEAPRETVEVQAASAPPVRPAADAPAAERAISAQRPGWRIRQVRRAMIFRQRLERLRQMRAGETVSPERIISRRSIAAVRPPAVRTLTPEQRARIRTRLESLTPEQRQRMREARERRMETLPAARARAAERRRDRIGQRLRDRGVDMPAQRPAITVPDTPDQPAVTSPPRTAPAATESPGTFGERRTMIIENTSPGPDPVALDQLRPNLPTADMPAATGARREALQQRIRAARAAERARAAQRRNGAQRPARPRVPPRRR